MNADSRQSVLARPALAQGGQAWAALAQFDGPLPLFWERYLQAVGQLLQARRVLLLASGVGQPWKALAQWPAQAHLWSGDPAELLQMLSGLVDEQPRLEHLPQGGQLLAMRLPQPAAAQVLAVVAGEGLAWTAAGAAAGLLLGLGVSLVLVHVINPQSFRWTMDLHVPTLSLLALALAVMAAGTLTAWLAGRAAASAQAVLAVKEDW